MEKLPLFNVVTIAGEASRTTQIAASTKKVAAASAIDAHREAHDLAPGVTVLVFNIKQVGDLDLVPR